MAVGRFPPQKFFRAKFAFGRYRKGDVFQPTGMYRDALINRGVIEECPDPNLPKQQMDVVTVRDTLTLRKRAK